MPARLFATDERRLLWLKTAVCLGLAGGVLSSGSLWLSERFLPMAPAFGWFPPTPFPLDALLLAALILLLGWIAVAQRPSKAIVAALALLALLVLQDQGRLYPSVYEYSFLLAALAAYGFTRPPDAQVPLRIARLIVVCVYVWSGIQKLDPNFAQVMFPALVRPALGSFADSPLIHFAGRLAPWLEIAAGLGLLSKKYRSRALWLALAIHLFSFFAIGPFRGAWLLSPWAWNLTTGLIAFILFYRADAPSWKEIALPKGALHTVVAVLFGFMPILNLFGYWDSALSFNIFSGNVTTGTMLLSDDLVRKLPDDVRSFARKDAQGRNTLSLEALSQAEFGAGLYAEPRIFRQIEKKFCAYATKPDDAVMILQERRNWFGTPPPEALDCAS